jgi:glycerol-3-phosphate acyltransferase PlsY
MPLLNPVIAVLAAYLIGSLSFAILVSRVFRLKDPRTYGSGNPGATNVLRSGHKAAAGITLVLDALKGWLPVLLVQVFGEPFGLGQGTAAAVALAAFLGHLWPVFFKFQGGKGVATAAGAIFGLNPWLGLATLATWLIVVAFFRYSSLAAIVSAVFAPFYQLLIWRGGAPAIAISIMGLLLIWRHSANIQKLLKGTESKLGPKQPASLPAAHGHHPGAPGQAHPPTPKHGHKQGKKR